MSLLKCVACSTALAGVWLVGCSPGTKESESASKQAAALPPFDEVTYTNDWPQWRFDANRSASAPFDLPPSLHLQWVRRYSPRVQTWDDPLNNDLLTYDRIFEPVILGDRVFVGFNEADKVVALDLGTGKELWTFYADGPVRLPPAGWRGRVYFSSDDGCLYCVHASTGDLVWKFRAGPSERKVLGNRRVVSTWPARGGPVVRDGKVYFAASIWPFMGTFIYALAADSGRVLWVNDSTGPQYSKQPHSAPAFAGVAPQGPLAATREFLLVPGGRSVPAVFERDTGKLVHFQLEDSGRGNGGSFVAASETEYFVHTRGLGTRAHELKTGKKGGFTCNEPVWTTNRLYSVQDYSPVKGAWLEAEQKLAEARQTEADTVSELERSVEEGDKEGYKKATNSLASARRRIDRAMVALGAAQTNLSTNWAGCVLQARGNDKQVRWDLPMPGVGDLIRAGRHLYVACSNCVVTVEWPQSREQKPRSVRTNAVEGQVLRLLAARDRLLAVTAEGHLFCFGGENRPAQTLQQVCPTPPPAELATQARELAEVAEARQGYALCFGVGDGRMLDALLQETELQLVVVDPNPATVADLRRRLDAAGVYGRRIAVHTGDPRSFLAPPYIANLVMVQGSMAAHLFEPGQLQAAYASVRPYGGWLWIAAPSSKADAVAKRITDADLAQARVSTTADGVAVVREGPLPGSADWTHQYADVANTVKSDDTLVRLPLGLLWFGGPSNMEVLPRHGHGPSEQVVGGRLIIEGMSWLSARDVYTGRTLWKTDFGDLGNYGVYFDSSYTNLPLSTIVNQKHIPGSTARGGNFVTVPDAIYVAVSNTCQVLDPATGQRTLSMTLPMRRGESTPPAWGYIGVCGDVLLGGAGFGHYTARLGLSTNSTNSTTKATPVVDLSGSLGLVAFDRHTGERLWRVEARHSFLHNGIVAGGDRVYCLDKLPKTAEDKLKRRGRKPAGDYRLAAYDLHTGQLLWQKTTNVFGTWLGYAKDQDILLQAGAKNTDRLKDEASQGMIAYQGFNGAVLWKKLDLKYDGPCIVYHDLVITSPAAYKTNAGAFHLQDGSPLTLPNPVTGLAEPLRIYRTYGCNHAIACENLMTFRSGSAGFYDLESHSGTGNFGGFKSSCSPNLIAADGVLSAPDYTRTCTCPYQNQTSLAMVHLPDSSQELWTYNQYGASTNAGRRIRRVGLNFGAPGDRLATNGTLWLDHPSVGGSSPYVYVSMKGPKRNYFRHQSTALSGQGPAWVMASGLRGTATILIGTETVKPPPPPPAGAKKKSEDSDDDDDDETNGVEESNGTNTVAGATNAVSGATNASNGTTHGAGGTTNGVGHKTNSITSGTNSTASSTNSTPSGTNSAASGTNALPGATNRLAGGTNLLANGTNSAAKAGGVKTNRAEVVYKPTLPAAPYTVRLYFAEPEDLKRGQRVFDVQLQGKKVLKGFDVVAAAGGPRRGLVKEFAHVMVKDALSIALAPTKESPLEPILCGVEMILEENLASPK